MSSKQSWTILCRMVKWLSDSSNQIILEQALVALGKHWHVNHFACGHCKLPIDSGKFVEKDGVAYCVKDYENLFLPKCEQCHNSITGSAIIAEEKKYHSDCFYCQKCKVPFCDSKYFIRENKRLCQKCAG